MNPLLIVLLSLLGLIIVLLLIFLLYTLILRKTLIKRYDYNPLLKYDEVDKLGDIDASMFAFYSGKNKLIGGFYTKKDVRDDLIIVFFHGLGGGHKAYSQVIYDLINTNNAPVYAYDNTGSGDSEGKSIIDMQNALKDGVSFFDYLSDNDLLKSKKVVLIGHSWGGYVATNLPMFLPHINIISIIGLNPLTGMDAMVKSYYAKLPLFNIYNKLYSKLVVAKYANTNAVISHKKTGIKTLIFVGQKDKVLRFKSTYTKLYEYSLDNDNIDFLVVQDRGHSAYLTAMAEKALQELFHNIKEIGKEKDPELLKKYLKTVDYKVIGENNMEIFNKISNFIRESDNE